MIIDVLRLPSIGKTTVSGIYIGREFICFGLEDQLLNMKFPGQTAIFEGTYKLGMRQYGKFYSKYTQAYPWHNKGMIEILDVPQFTDILIHPGNTADDTAGCLLTAQKLEHKPKGSTMQVIGYNSIDAYRSLYTKISNEVAANNAHIRFFNGSPVEPTFNNPY